MNERDIFIAALQKDAPAERQVYLEEACRGDEALRRGVQALLEAHERAGSFLERPSSSPVATADESVAERPGTVIGPYKLLERVGEGGMGLVFVAEQQEPVRRKVALKVLKPGMDTRQVVARFEAERQALALMDHPHIARVFDGGTTPAGRPYFVMELVKGLPITDYCDRNGLPVRERLGLFVAVCQAVQHAHQKGVIHRDIKPSNVLVVSHDGTPVAKVIDFGIAKAVGQRLTDKTVYTQLAQLIGTPLYMSPEQAGQSGLDVDTRSDIYSLGVLLYELLTGTTPFDQGRLQGVGFDELRRIIREEEPPKPSTRISTLGQVATTVGTNRKSDPRQLSRLCRGELDWIVMKALEKDRNRRYESASAFAADVGRYLEDEPVLACPPSAAYRLGKFARRHRGRLAVAGLALLFLVLLGGGIGWAVREQAARQARVAGQVELILQEVERLEREQKWPEALAAAKQVEAALAGGEADGAIQQRVGEAQRNLAFVAKLDRIRQERAATVDGQWRYAEASRDYARAFHDYGVDVESLPAEDAIARLRGNLALAAPVAAALDDWVEARRELSEGEPRWKPLAAVARGLDPDPLRDRLRAAWGREVPPELLADLRRLVESIDVNAQSPAALDALARTLDQAKRADAALRILRDGQHAHPTDFWLSFNLGLKLWQRKDFTEAARFFTAAVSMRPDSPAAHDNLGVNLAEQKRLDEAVAEFRKAIALDPKYAHAHSSLGVYWGDRGQWDEAVAEYRKAIELAPKYAEAHAGLGVALEKQGKLDEAIAECRKAIALDPKYALAHNSLGIALRDQGKWDDAIACYRRAIALDPKEAAAHANLGNALYQQGKLDEAVAEHRKAIALDRKEAKPHNNLAIALRRQGKLDEAVAEYRRAIALDPKEAAAHANLGNALADQGKLEEAVAECREAIRLKPDFADAHYSLGYALACQGKLDEAVAECRKAIALDPKNARAHSALGVALDGQGKPDEAIACYRKAIAVKPDYADAHCNLGHALVQQGDFRAALEELRRGHELGSRNPGWRYPSAQWVRQCERLIELDGKLPGFLERKATPANAGERIELAELCIRKHMNGAAARFYEGAFTAEPKLAEALNSHRDNAACAAALAGCGQGKDADKLDEKEKVRLRGRALAWLRADLEAMGRLLDKGADPARLAAGVGSVLRRWQADPDLAGVRGPEALGKLPEAERQAWKKLWADAADVLARAQARTTPGKKSDAK